MLSIVVLGLLLQQQPTSIQGIVLKFGSDEPLSKAIIDLQRVGASSPSLTATTTDDGKFLFPNLVPDSYRISATRPGYVRSEYQQNLPLTLNPGQPPADIKLEMIATGAIYGRVFDEFGKPLANATVQALKWVYENRRRQASVVQTALTNDLGEYRLFWLPPGPYHVGVLSPVDGRPVGNNLVVMNPNGTNRAGDFIITTGPLQNAVGAPFRYQSATSSSEWDQTVYYPGTINQEMASSVDVRSGSNLGSIDVVFAAGQPRRVTGVVVDGETGQAARGAVLTRTRNPIPPGGSGSHVAPVSVNPDDGSFDMPRVAPGSYLLAGALDGADGPKGKTRIDVGAADLANVTIVLTNGFDLPGRISSPGVIGNLRVTLQPMTPGGAEISVVPGPDGGFVLTKVRPDDYRVYVAPTRNAYVKAIRLGSIDVLNGGLHLDGRPAGVLEVFMGANPGRIEGIVSTGREGPIAGATLALLPSPPDRYRTDLFYSTRTGADGRFEVAGLVPGDYRIFAWQTVEDGAWFDAEFMSGYEIRGIPVHVEEGMTLELDIPAIGPRL